MASKRWKGGAAATADVWTLTVGGTPQLPAPAAPTLTLVLGSSNQATVFVVVTYVNAVGETAASAATSQALASNQQAQVTSPPAEGSGAGAPTGYNVYSGTASGGPYYLQNTTGPIAIGTAYEIPGTPASSGKTAPTSNTASGMNYTVAIGYRSLSYTSIASDTNNTVASALQAILSASAYGEFLEYTWTASNNVITATGKTAGVPGIIGGSATGTGTLTAAHATVSSGPNDVSIAANWDAGTVPAAGDDVYFDHSEIDALWNLQIFNGIAFNSLTISSTFQQGSMGNGTIGLPEVNANGTPYLEYRQQYLQCSPTTVAIGDGSGNGSGRIKLDFGAGQVNAIVYGTGTSLDADLQALFIKGTNTNNVVNVMSGSVGVAVFGNESATLNTLLIGSGANGAPQVYTGTGCTVTTLTMEDGTVVMENGAATITKNGGSLTVMNGNVTTWNEYAGGSAYLGAGAITTLVASAILDFSQDPHSRTVTNATFNPGGGFNDPMGTVTWSNPFLVNGLLSDVSLSWGRNRHVALT